MGSYTISGKIYDTDQASVEVALNEKTDRYEDVWYGGKHGVKSSLWLSKKGQWFQTFVRVFDEPEAKLISNAEAAVLMINHGQREAAKELFGERLKDMEG